MTLTTDRVVESKPHDTDKALTPGVASSSFEAARRRITDLMAAGAIADPKFPAGGLPRVASLPFLSLAHQVLFDRDRYAQIVWTVGLSLKDRLESLRRAYRIRLWISLGIGAVLGTLALAGSQEPALGFIAAVSSFLLVLIVSFLLVDRRATLESCFRSGLAPSSNCSRASSTFPPIIATRSSKLTTGSIGARSRSEAARSPL